MNKLSRNMGNILVCIFEILIGVLLLIDPIGFTSKIIMGAGVVLLILGIWNVFKYFKEPPEVAALDNCLANGLLFMLIGGFCTFKAEWFVLTFPVLTVIYGVFNLIIGICKVQWAADMLRAKHRYWYAAAFGAVITLVFAVLILVNPFASTQFLWTFIAITMILEAIIDLLTAVMRGKKFKEETNANTEQKESDLE